MNFVATIILARLLAPEQFGLMGFGLVGIQYLDILSRFGLDVALVSRRDKIEIAANTTFIMSLVTGTVFYIAAWFTAPLLATFFREPEITSLFRVLAIVLLVDSFSLVHHALLKRNLKFRSKLLPDMGKGLAKGGTSIFLALSGYGVWSLVYGQIAGATVAAILFWFLIDWRPKLQFERQTVKEIVGYGINMIAVEFVGALRNNVDYLFVGRLLGAATLGLYTMAYRLPELLIKSMNNVVGAVTHPVMSRMQGDGEQLNTYYFAYLRYIAALTFPAGIGMAIIAPAFVTTFYTDAWAEAIFPMQCISIALSISSIGFIPGVLYKAINRPDILNKTSLFKLPFFLAVIGYAVTLGLNAVALVQIILAVFYITVDTIVARRIIDFQLRSLFQALAPPFVSTLIMGAAAGWVAQIMTANNLFEIVAVAVTGVVIYIATLRLVSRQMFDEVISLARSY